MEHIGKFVAYLILAVNALFVGTLILSAYSPYLNPKINPLASSLGLAFPIFLTINLIFIGFWAFVNYRYTLLPAIGFLICIPQIRTYIPFNSTTKTIPAPDDPIDQRDAHLTQDQERKASRLNML